MEAMTTAVLELMRDSYWQFVLLVAGVALLAFAGKCHPARRTFILVLLPLPLLLADFWWPGSGLFVFLYNPLLLLALLVDRFVLSADPGQLSVHRALSRQMGINRPHTIRLILTNNSRETINAVMRDAVPGALVPATPAEAGARALEQVVRMPAFDTVTVSYQVTPVCRGAFAFGKLHVKYKSRLGLLWLHGRLGRGETIKVLPDVKRVRAMQVKYARGQVSGLIRKRFLGSEGTRFEGLRGYFNGDDVRKMDWKATARLDDPVVRVFAHEVEQPVLVLLDAGRKMSTAVTDGSTHNKLVSKFDWALNAALAFSGVAIERGDQVGATVFNNRIVRTVPFGKGRKHLQTLVDKLSDIQPEPVESAYDEVMLHTARTLGRRSLVVVVTDLVDPAVSRLLLSSVSALAGNHLVMVVTFNDPALLRMADQVPENTHDVYMKGVALDLLSERERAFARLAGNRSIVALDVRPEQMDEALINQYLAAKFKNRL